MCENNGASVGSGHAGLDGELDGLFGDSSFDFAAFVVEAAEVERESIGE